MAGGRMFLGKKQVAGKRGRGRPRKKGTRYVPNRPINRVKKGVMPFAYNNAMTWSSGFVTSTTAGYFTFGMFANRMLNPAVSLTLPQPRWYDEMVAIYNTNRVYAVKITLIIENLEPISTARNSTAYIGMLNRDYLAPVNQLEIEQKPRLFKTKIIPRNTGIAKISKFMTIAQMDQTPYDQADIISEYQEEATDANTPVRRPLIYVGAYSLDPSINTTYTFRILATFYTRWTNLKSV